MYCGGRARSVVKAQQFRCGCGQLSPAELAISVDAAESPELARHASEGSLDRALHIAGCQACGNQQVLSAPYTYHDGAERLFVLVLPEAWRHRELLERAELLRELAHEDSRLPAYVAEFGVVYGSAGLQQCLHKAREKSQDLDRDASRLREVEKRLEEAAARELRIQERERDLQQVTQKLDARSSTLTEKELGLHDRKSALDRRSAELERKTLALEEARTQLRAQTEGERQELPEVLKDDQTAVLDDEQILTSAPDPSLDGRMRVASASAAGTSGGFRPSAPESNEGLDALVAPLEQSAASDAETRIGPSASVAPVRAASEIATGEHFAQDTQPQLSRVLSRLKDAGSGPMPPATEIGEEDVTVAAPSDNEVEAWRQRGEQVLKLLRGQELRLVASLGAAALEELMAGDIRALLQLHRMPTYPLVSLTLARSNTLGGKGDGYPFSFHFDIGSTEDRNALECLAKDFRFTLELFDAAHRPIRQRRLSAPLAANVGYVMTLAADARKSIPAQKRSFESAMRAFDSQRHDRLGRGHVLAKEFRDSALDGLARPSELMLAIAQCEKFSEPAGQEYLVAIRSYPFDRWHERRLQVIRRALEVGLWMGPALARVAVSEELVRSRKELIVTSQKHFAAFVGAGHKSMGEEQIAANWSALNEEARCLGLTPPAVLSSAAESVASGMIRRAPSSATTNARLESDAVLLARLSQPDARLQVIVELCQRKTLTGVDPLFRALAELPWEEAAEAFAAVTGLGNQAAESLLVLLSCPSSHLRHGAAMALCELGNGEGIDSICEAIMADEDTMWREYAYALGRVGSSAIMPLVARMSSQGQRGQARAVWSLGYIAAQGARKPVENLARGRDAQVAQVASAALELSSRIQAGSVAAERDASEQAYSERFYRALSGTHRGYAGSDRSGPAMLLDEGDLMEAIE